MTDNTARYLKEAATAMAEFGPKFDVTYTWDTIALRFTLVECSATETGFERSTKGAVSWDALAESGFNPLVHELNEARLRLKAKPWR